MVDCLLKIALTCCYDTHGDSCFGKPHRRALGSVEVGARLDYLGGERFC
jgi:hypothetical protein